MVLLVGKRVDGYVVGDDDDAVAVAVAAATAKRGRKKDTYKGCPFLPRSSNGPAGLKGDLKGS